MYQKQTAISTIDSDISRQVHSKIIIFLMIFVLKRNYFIYRWEEALNLSSHEFKTPFIGIIQMSSEVTQAVMERCVTRVYYDQDSEKKSSVNLILFYYLII